MELQSVCPGSRHLEVCDKWSWSRCRCAATPVTSAFGMHRTGTASPENTCRNEQGPTFVICFIKAQTVASNNPRNLTHGVVKNDSWKQPKTEMRKVSWTFMLILATGPATCRLNALHTSVLDLTYICCKFNLQIYSKLDTSKRQWTCWVCAVRYRDPYVYPYLLGGHGASLPKISALR